MRTKNPQCNYCDYILDDEELWYGENSVGKVHTGVCDTSEIKCPSCKKTFYVQCVHELRFDQVDKDGHKI